MVIQIKSHVLYYEHTGEGRPLILLHGNKEDHHIFDELISELEGSFEIFALDSRGHGMSAKEDEYHYSDMAEDVTGFIEALHIERPLLVGYSDGGIIALLVGIGHSELISGIIACGPNLNPKALTLSTRMEIKREYRKDKDPRTLMMLNEPDIRESELGQISVPTLIMAGEKDIAKKSHFEKIAAAVPGGRLEMVTGADHGSYVVHSTNLAEVVLREVSSVPDTK